MEGRTYDAITLARTHVVTCDPVSNLKKSRVFDFSCHHPRLLTSLSILALFKGLFF